MSMVAYKAPYLLQIMMDDEPLNPRTDYDNFGHMICWHSRYNLGDQHNFEDTNDFLRELVSNSFSADIVIDYVKSGKLEGIKLEYDPSESSWDISTYDSRSNKWCLEISFFGSLEEHKQEVFEGLLDEFVVSELYMLAAEKNIILPLNLYDHSMLSMSVSSFLGRAQHAQWDSGQVGWIYATAEDIEKEYGNLTPESYDKAKALLKSEVECYDYYLSGQCYGFRLYENGEETDSCWGFLGSFSDMAKEIASQSLPETHQDMVDDLQEVSDTVTRYKGYEDLMEDLEEMEV
ncbi:hypothetical protein DS742_16270 [Lacrimispora amygdalina]|uniref:Uncharacterized protein n=1 Tax=Lacrimispora amygdalina TaxID=253257 RepID=A0A3E2N9X6_9FIRM|nr:hypothetical protein [Clostridium indicum]RFZ77808.1 hypothetical protein DS742_16270 [Clostridium indicum]